MMNWMNKMNERIQEFAQLAGIKLPVGGFPNYDEFDFEKFAELIVRECVQTLINNTPEHYTNEASEEDWDKGYDRAMKDCVHHIQEHFGVE